ncbi:MAG: hypothetical protein WA030_02920 [Candidatus Microsaccharimonas sp.]
MNDIRIDCSIDIAIHRGNTNKLLLIIPGVDGTLDGYQDKYKIIAQSINDKHDASVIRINNPFITSYHWESNIRNILEYIRSNQKKISPNNNKPYDIRIMAHSAGAAIVARIAWEYPDISRVLLVNPAAKLGLDKIVSGLNNLDNQKAIVIFGENDPARQYAELLGAIPTTTASVVNGADHNFTGESFSLFLDLADHNLFNESVTEMKDRERAE